MNDMPHSSNKKECDHNDNNAEEADGKCYLMSSEMMGVLPLFDAWSVVLEFLPCAGDTSALPVIAALNTTFLKLVRGAISEMFQRSTFHTSGGWNHFLRYHLSLITCPSCSKHFFPSESSVTVPYSSFYRNRSYHAQLCSEECAVAFRRTEMCVVCGCGSTGIELVPAVVLNGLPQQYGRVVEEGKQWVGVCKDGPPYVDSPCLCVALHGKSSWDEPTYFQRLCLDFAVHRWKNRNAGS